MTSTRAAPLRPSPRGLVAAALVGYLVGMLPSADIVSRVVGSGEDLRAVGSGNPGALNVAEVLGRRWGVVVLGADMAKGAGAGVVGRCVAGDIGAYVGATTSVAGHIAPLWNGFRGGKGVATSAGACLAVFPVYFPIDAAIAAATATASQRAERSIQLSCGAWIAATLLWWRLRLPNGWGPPPGPALTGFAVGSSAMILAKFRAARRSSR